MRAATKKALLASIDHWRQNEKATTLNDVHIGPDACALCSRFGAGGRTKQGDWVRCIRITPSTSEPCPIHKATGAIGCVGTPYGSCRRATFARDLRAFRRAAKKEREFLESLLPSSQSPAKP